MHFSRWVPALTMGLALMAGCSSASEAGSDSNSAPPAPTSTDACAEVREGINAFNDGDYAETVDHFRSALPLAMSQAENDDSKPAADLVEAVEYYADLAPEEYPEAARSSDDFAKYKAITLGQCAPAEFPEEEPPVLT